MRNAVALMRGQGKSDAEIRDQYIESDAYKESALPVVEEVVGNSLYEEAIANGLSPADARRYAEKNRGVMANQAVGEMQQKAKAGDMSKLAIVALPIAALLLKEL